MFLASPVGLYHLLLLCLWAGISELLRSGVHPSISSLVCLFVCLFVCFLIIFGIVCVFYCYPVFSSPVPPSHPPNKCRKTSHFALEKSSPQNQVSPLGTQLVSFLRSVCLFTTSSISATLNSPISLSLFRMTLFGDRNNKKASNGHSINLS